MDSTIAASATDPFSKYQIGEAVGKGAFGKVYKALNTETGDFCAIKQIEKNIISEKQLPAILQEIKLLQTLQHVNIVRFIESHETPKYLFFALEFIEGGSLTKIAKRYGNFQEPLLSKYICQVLRGLEYLHEKGVIHRDIKSDNILITKDGVIKLADFGSCTYSALDRKLTVVGTPFWMAPEVIQMDMNARSTACDIWSLGCTILELLTGNPPYWDLGTMPAMFAMVNNPHPPLPTNISAELKNFLLACFVRDINRRPTATQLLEHPWIKMHAVAAEDPKKGHRVSVSGRHITASVSSSFDEDQHAVDTNHEDEAVSSDLKERVVQLETQKKEMSHTIQKLKIHFIRAMREKKLMKEMIAQLVQERDSYMLKLGLTPPPPPSILNSNNNSTGRSNADQSTTDLLSVDSPSKHSRSSSAPISPPLKIASSSPTPLTTGGASQSSYKSTSNILASDFFQPSDSDSDGEDGGSDYLISSFGDLHAGVSSRSGTTGAKRIPPKLSRDSSDKPEYTSNPSLGGYFSTSNNLQVYHQSNIQAQSENVNVNVYGSSPSQYAVGGSLNIGNGHNSLGNNSGILVNGQPQPLSSGGSLKSNSFNSSLGNGASSSSNSGTGSAKKVPPMLQRESSQKSALNQYLSNNGNRRDSISKDSGGALGIGLSGGMINNNNGSIGSNNGSAPRKSSQPIPLNQSSERSILSSSSSTDDEPQQTVPPVESVVVNVQPPRVGDECKVKCGDGWYDAIVELVSGTTFVVTIKPFNIKQEVSHSDVTLAPLQFPVNNKKKSKFSLFGKTSK